MSGGAITFPTAETIARAMVAAATACDELQVLQSKTEAILTGRAMGLRSPWLVLAALDAAYPRVDLPRMGRWVGLEAYIYAQELSRRRKAMWWRQELVDRLFAMVAP